MCLTLIALSTCARLATNKIDDMNSKELQIGKVGEYLVCADLILKGFVAYPSEQGLPYDVVLDIDGELYKVQVKTTTTYRTIPQRKDDMKSYVFNIKRKGKYGKKRYANDEIDIFALVCLDTMQIGYIKNADMPTTISFRVDDLRGTYYDEQGKGGFSMCVELFKQGKSRQEIAGITKIPISRIYRYLNYKKDYTPFETNARYFSDIVRDKNWFKEL